MYTDEMIYSEIENSYYRIEYRRVTECVWKWDTRREWWKTSCDTGFDIERAAVLEDDDFANCPHCFGKIRVEEG